MQRASLYKVWVGVGFGVIVLTAAATVVVLLTIPPDCKSCGMASIGLVPFWLLSLLILLINSIAIPVYNTRHKATLQPWFANVTWTYGILSILALCWVMVATIVYG